MDSSKYDFIIKQMNIRTPVLLLGAGFSIGAVNKNGDKLPSGKDLAQKLYSHFYDSGLLKSNEEIDNKKKDLKEVCTYLRLSGKVEERNKIITDCFTGILPSHQGFHRMFSNYRWNHIFTLNVDDLVENIYSEAGIPLSVCDFEKNDNSERSATLFKLHGSVSSPDKGYIFDENEYRDFTIEGSYLLKEFAHDALSNDLILIGTEYCEEDLKTIVGIYEKAGYNDRYYKFFISPSLTAKTKLWIEKQKNAFWIDSTAEEFFEVINKRVCAPADTRSILKQCGVLFLDEINNHSHPHYTLYQGARCVYEDFYHDIDILNQDSKDWLRKILSADSKVAIVLYGDTYIGKTCAAKRLLVNLEREGFFAVELLQFEDGIEEELIAFFKELPCDSKVAIYINDATQYYSRIHDLLTASIPSVSKFVIIAESEQRSHSRKRYLLVDDLSIRDYILEYKVNSSMNNYYANQIFTKLARNNRLGNYLTLVPPKCKVFSKIPRERITNQILIENDIIDALYYSTHGDSFENYYKRYLKKRSEPEQKLIKLFCYLEKLGIHSMPTPLIVSIAKYVVHSFSIQSFIENYNDIFYVEDGNGYLRHGRILFSILPDVSQKDITHMLSSIVKYTIPHNGSRENKRLINIFECALHVKSILRYNILSKIALLEFFESIETECKTSSYFWMQYGIVAQKNQKYEDANNHLLYARRMKDTYQVEHALAKNKMCWGLAKIQESFEIGINLFEEGAHDMDVLIRDRRYSRSYRYSVHTYVNLWLTLSEETGNIIDNNICDKITLYLNGLSNCSLDNILFNIIKKYISYCKQNGLSQYCNSLKWIYNRTPQYMMNYADYDD